MYLNQSNALNITIALSNNDDDKAELMAEAMPMTVMIIGGIAGGGDRVVMQHH